MGHGAGLVQEEETRRGEKSTLAAGNYAQRAIGI
jgi:hypothetical protein